MSLEFVEVDKTFGRTQVLKKVSFSVGHGEIVGLLGPNGSGKTTTMRMAAGSNSPDAGLVKVRVGQETLSRREVLKRMGYLPERPPLYDALSVLDFLGFVAQVKRLPSPTRAVREVLESCALGKVVHKRISRLSKGFRQRVGLAQALLGKPNVLLLDEPTSGLDPLQVREIRELIARDAKERVTLLSTHIIEEAVSVCSRLLLIREGEIAYEYDNRGYGNVAMQRIRLRGADPISVKRVLSSLNGLKSFETAREEEGILSVKCVARKGSDLSGQLAKELASTGELLELSPIRDSLEDHLIQVYGEGSEKVFD